jgi:aspartate 1-decarboxylase
MRTMLKGKIHRATVTEANVDYEGSITVDSLLLEAAGIVEFEQVQVLDINNGSRLTTYAIEGEPGSGVVCINGAAARLVDEGDLVIILAYDLLTEEEALAHRPQLVYVNGRNQIVRTARDIPVGVH